MFGLFGKKEGGKSGPDFSRVISEEDVQRLVREGRLEPMLLLPETFGGTSDVANRVYVPTGLAALKSQTDDNVIMPLAVQGKVTRYSATPKYSGRSRVPVQIEISASDPGDFLYTLTCWG